VEDLVWAVVEVVEGARRMLEKSKICPIVLHWMVVCLRGSICLMGMTTRIMRTRVRVISMRRTMKFMIRGYLCGSRHDVIVVAVVTGDENHNNDHERKTTTTTMTAQYLYSNNSRRK
jgi:hypothetical protein